MLNLGILAHVDAGKTSLTERLLFAAGIIDEVGSVDAGSTQTDSLDLERQRGITIKSAVVSFVVGDTAINLIDTPGHPDFIAEVERVLGVLDGAVLVVSAVEGVQPQTRVLMRTLQRLRIPTLLFVNKVDRRGADAGRVLGDLAERLTPAVVAMGSVTGLGTRACGFVPYGAADAAFTARLADLLADHDEALLAAYLDDEAALPYRRLRRALRLPDRPGPGPPGLLRLGHHRRRGRRPDRRDHRAAAGRRRRRRRPRLGQRVQGRARAGRREGGVSAPVLGHGPGAGPAGLRRPARCATRAGSPRSPCSIRAGPCGGRRSRPGGSPSSGGWPRSRSATPSAGRRRRRPGASSPRRPWRRWWSPAGRPTGAPSTPPWPSWPSRTR